MTDHMTYYPASWVAAIYYWFIVAMTMKNYVSYMTVKKKTLLIFDQILLNIVNVGRKKRTSDWSKFMKSFLIPYLQCKSAYSTAQSKQQHFKSDSNCNNCKHISSCNKQKIVNSALMGRKTSYMSGTKATMRSFGLKNQ